MTRESAYAFLGREGKKPKTRTFRLSLELMEYVEALGRKHNRKALWQLVHIVEAWIKDHPEESSL